MSVTTASKKKSGQEKRFDSNNSPFLKEDKKVLEKTSSKEDQIKRSFDFSAIEKDDFFHTMDVPSNELSKSKGFLFEDVNKRDLDQVNDKSARPLPRRTYREDKEDDYLRNVLPQVELDVVNENEILFVKEEKISTQRKSKGDAHSRLYDLLNHLETKKEGSKVLLDPHSLDFVLASLTSKSWKKLLSATKILEILLEPDNDILKKTIVHKAVLSKLFNLLDNDVVSHKSDQLRINVMNCISSLLKLSTTLEETTELTEGITILIKLYASPSTSPEVSTHLLRIFQQLSKSSKLKDQIIKQGFDKNLLKKSNLVKSVVDTVKSSFYKRSATSSVVPPVPLLPTTPSAPLTISSSPSISNPKEFNTVPIYQSSINLAERKQLKRKSAPNVKHNPERLLHTAPPDAVERFTSSTGISSPTTRSQRALSENRGKKLKQSPRADPIKEEFDEAKKLNKMKAKKPGRATRTISNSKIRVKCKWEKDNRFIWLNKGTTLEELLKAIEKEYGQTVSIGQVKYMDPSDKSDLITITKEEDIELCFSDVKPELYILLNLTPRNTPITPRTHLTPPTTPRGLNSGKVTRLAPRTPTQLSKSTSTPHSILDATPKRTSWSKKKYSNITPPNSPLTGSLSPRDNSPAIVLDDGKIHFQEPTDSVKKELSRNHQRRSEKHPPNVNDTPKPTISVDNVDNKRKPFKSPEDMNFPRWVILYQDIKFEEGTRLGGGFFGEVRKGYWRGSPVACKFVYDKSFRQKSDVELFEKEVNILSSLRHPNVILYMGVCIDTNFKIIVMEYMEKGSLNDLLRKEPFTLGKMFKIAKEIALGMNYLHGEGILHRDLTSKNILLSSHMQAKVADFGLSKIKLAESQNVSFTMGSIAWMAPEVIENASNFTRASDVYSYGIILWEMCTGEDPCPRDIQPVHFAKLVLESGYRPEIPPTVSPKWKALIETCWDTLPKSRPSFEQILIRLEKMHTNFSPKQLSREIFLPAPVQRNNSPNTDQQINSEYGVMLGEDED